MGLDDGLRLVVRHADVTPSGVRRPESGGFIDCWLTERFMAPEPSLAARAKIKSKVWEFSSLLMRER